MASFDPAALSRDTGIPVEVLLTSFDTWDDDTVEIFMDHMTDDSNYCGMTTWDNSGIEKYTIEEKQR